MLLSVRASIAAAPAAIGARAARRTKGPRPAAAADAPSARPRRPLLLLSPRRRRTAAPLPTPPAAAPPAAAANVPPDCLLPLCAVCLAFWLTSATISAAINFVLQLLGRPAYAGAGGPGGGGGSGPGLLAGIGPTRAGSSGGWVAAGVYESDIMRLPLGAYYEVPSEPQAAGGEGSGSDAGASASAPPTSFVIPLPSSPDDWASAEAAPPTAYVPASKLQVLSPGRLQAGLTTSRTRQFDDLKISLVPPGGEGADGGGGGGGTKSGAAGSGSAGGLGDGTGLSDGSDGLDDMMGGGGRRRPGSGPRSGPGDVPPPAARRPE